jgi:hypothetical protein
MEIGREKAQEARRCLLWRLLFRDRNPLSRRQSAVSGGPGGVVAVAGGGTRVWQWCGLTPRWEEALHALASASSGKLDRHSGRANNAHIQQLSKLELIAAGR